MATYYVDPVAGLDAHAGTSWGTAKLTLAGADAVATAAGDKVYIGPGVYREILTPTTAGGSAYTTGTCSVTSGSATVTGSGTTWSGTNAVVGGIFQIPVLAHGTDGVTNGSGTFTSASGNFQSSMIGRTIRINTKGQYIISAPASATSITITLLDGSSASPSSASSLTYDVGPSAPYEIASVDSTTQVTLTEPWSEETLTGAAYRTFNPIRWIFDVTGEHTDGIGGICRITGSDNDTTATRARAVEVAVNGLVIQGFSTDTTTTDGIRLNSVADVIVQDFAVQGLKSGYQAVVIQGASQARNTVRRGQILVSNSGFGFLITHSAPVDNAAHLIENVDVVAGQNGTGIDVRQVGGTLIRNCNLYAPFTVDYETAGTTGQGMTLRHCTMMAGIPAVSSDAGAGSFVDSDYCNIWGGTGTIDANSLMGSHSTTVPPLFDTPHPLAPGFARKGLFGGLSQWSSLRAKAGLSMPPHDMGGIRRPITDGKRSWGSVQFQPESRSTLHRNASATSIKLADAGSVFKLMPVSAVSTVITFYCYREANYAGTNPQLIIHQPGQADIVLTDVGSSAAINTLTNTWTPAAAPGFIVLEFRSNNTATSGSYNVYFSL